MRSHGRYEAANATSRFARPTSDLAWGSAAVVLTVLIAASRLLVTPGFYYADDTQTGTAGQWWHLGGELLAGRLPLLNVHAWTAGNYLAEGQWGIFNPMIWLIAVVMRLVADPLLVITVVKIAALAVMTLGAYALSRSFRATRPWSAAAGVLVPLGGFTVYMDAPSWTTGLLAAALVPWSWYGLRRHVEDRRSPAVYLVATGLLVTLGYVFGVIVLVIIFTESLVRFGIRRDWARVRGVLIAGVFAGLLTVAVYLPGILTAPVTIRNSAAVFNTGFLNADMTDLFAASTATVTGSIGSWGTGATTAPLVYTLWALPAFALFWPSRHRLRALAPLLWVGIVLLLIVTGPDQVGPIRWPVRFMPYVVLVVCVAFASIASGRRARAPRMSLLASFALLALLSWVSVVNTTWEWRQVAASFAVQAFGILVLWWILHRPLLTQERSRTASAIAASLAGAALVVPQMYFFASTPLPQLGFGSDVTAMRAVPGDVPGDAIVVGDIYAGWRDPATFGERLVANQWYFSGTTVSSLYTVLPYRAYVEDLCADLRGSTCGAALATLTSTDNVTGRDLAELLGVNTIVVMKSSFGRQCPATPAGWTVHADDRITCVLVRVDPTPIAGGISWVGNGTQVEEVSRSSTDVTFRVDAVGTDARVVLSRLAWPGYRVRGAEQVQSVRGYLLTVDVASAEPGELVTVSFRPPGWGLEISALIAALLIAVGWPIARVVVARQSFSRRSATVGSRLVGERRLGRERGPGDS